MPIYEYTCQQCDARFEKLVRAMSAADETAACPKCKSKRTARTLSVFAVGAQAKPSTATSSPPCGHCGGAPGSCMSR